MLRIRIIAVGKLKESWWKEAQAEFLKRLSPFARVEIVEVAAEALTDTVSDEVALKIEGARILGHIKEGERVVAMDRIGKKVSSEQFAEVLGEAESNGDTLAFVIGGSVGIHPDVLAKAVRKVSFGDITLTHEMARVLLLEQVYRGVCINTGKKYHK